MANSIKPNDRMTARMMTLWGECRFQTIAGRWSTSHNAKNFNVMGGLSWYWQVENPLLYPASLELETYGTGDDLSLSNS